MPKMSQLEVIQTGCPRAAPHGPDLEPAEPVRRCERKHPGELIYIDITMGCMDTNRRHQIAAAKATTAQ